MQKKITNSCFCHFYFYLVSASCFGYESCADFFGTVLKTTEHTDFYLSKAWVPAIVLAPVTHLSHLLGPHSVLNQPLHICSHGEARSLENLFGKMQQLLSGMENQATWKLSLIRIHLWYCLTRTMPSIGNKASRVIKSRYAIKLIYQLL